jgi:hypothetical protein
MRMRAGVLALLLVLAAPIAAASPPTLSIATSTAEALPGARVSAVIALRSDDARTITLGVHCPPDFLIVGAVANVGTVAIDDQRSGPGPQPVVHWTGVVSSTQPITMVVTYQVLPDAGIGDRVITATGQLGALQLAASTIVRVVAPGRMYLPILQGG